VIPGVVNADQPEAECHFPSDPEALTWMLTSNTFEALTDTYFLVGNVGVGGVAVEPEAVFHGWRSARRECLPGITR